MFANELLAFLYPLVSVPDFVNQVARPWAGAVPMLGAGLLLLLGVAYVIRVLRRDEPGVSDERAVLVVSLICLLLAACASATRRATKRAMYSSSILRLILLAISALAALAREIARAAGSPRTP